MILKYCDNACLMDSSLGLGETKVLIKFYVFNMDSFILQKLNSVPSLSY